MSQIGSELEKGIWKQLSWSFEVEGHQRGQKGEERVRSMGLQEGSPVMVG